MSLMLTKKLGYTTLFTKLLLGFLAVILLLAAFNLVSFFYLKRQIHQEIVKYNELSINHAVEGYEDHFRLTREMVLGLNQNSLWATHINLLRHARVNKAYGYVNDVIAEMKQLYTNPFLYIDNLIIDFRSDTYVIEKDGTSSAKAMFGTYYISPSYPPEFWDRQFDESYAYRVFPAAAFTENTAGHTVSKGVLMPMIIKMMPYRDMYFIVMIDAQKLTQDLHVSISDQFYILNADGQPLYQTSADMKSGLVTSFDPDRSFMQTKDYYYFYKKGAGTGFTYVSRVPVQSISGQLLNLNLILLSLLAIVGVLIVLTFLFSRRMHQPIRLIVDELKGYEADAGSGTDNEPVREIELITRKMHHMRISHQSISRDLARKNSMLRHYAYTNKLKNIHMNLKEIQELTDTSLPYVVVVYQVLFKDAFEHYQQKTGKGSYYLRVYVDNVWRQAFPDAVTIQTEPHQILTLLFLPDPEADLTPYMQRLLQVFSVDRDSYLVTMAHGAVQPAGADFTAAYEQVQERLKLRRLVDETQWIRPDAPDGGVRGERYLKAMWEQEFQTRLMSGSEEGMQEWVRRSLDQLEKKQAVASDYRQFAKDVAGELDKALRQLPPAASADAGGRPPLEETRRFYCRAQYERWFADLLHPVLQGIRRKTEEHDPITSFVTEYMCTHLDEDINLDMMADKLNITSGYLSTYFKEKTGVNFSDYLNDLRIRTAKELLQNLDLRIQDVAARVGYRNVNSFIRMFKRHAGITPGEYRRKYAS